MARKTKAPPVVEPEESAEDLELDDQGDELDELQEDEPEEDQGEPPVDVPTGPAPHYLERLLALPGIPAGLLDGINPAAAWIQVATRDMPAQSMPLGHLAPDALDTLQDMGYELHARFELRPFYNAPDVRYFAAVLPELPEDEDGDGDEPADQANGAMIQLARSQDARMTRLEELVLKLANRDPFAEIERALGFVERITESVSGLRGSDGDADIIKTAIAELVPRLLPPVKEP